MFQSLVGAMRTSVCARSAWITGRVSIPRRGNEDRSRPDPAPVVQPQFQSLVGAMRTPARCRRGQIQVVSIPRRGNEDHRARTRRLSVLPLVSIPRRGNEDRLRTGRSSLTSWFQSLVGAMRTRHRVLHRQGARQVSIPRRGNEDWCRRVLTSLWVSLFQSLVGAMRTEAAHRAMSSRTAVSIPRRGNEDCGDGTRGCHGMMFQSLVGAMRTSRPLCKPESGGPCFNPS